MARHKTLRKSKHLKWLVENYSKYPSNKVLAQKLNDRIQKEFESEIAKCTTMYSKAKTAKERLLLASRIESLKSVEVTPRMVQYYASQLCLRKSSRSVSAKNSQNGRQAWKPKEYEEIECITDWFRSVTLGKHKYGKLKSSSLIPGFRSSLCRWNKEEGSLMGIHIKSSIVDRSSALVSIIALRAEKK